MNHVFLSHSAKPFTRDFLRGDMSIAVNWNILLPPAPVPKIILVHWRKPPGNWVKVNTDGSFYSITKKGAVGEVLRDEDGRILKGFQSFIGTSSILYAELIGIWQALKINHFMGFNRVIVESDSMVALRIIAKHNQKNWRLVILLSKIIHLHAHRVVKFDHIYKWRITLNIVLASQQSLIFEPGDYPIHVRQMACSDKSGRAYIRRTIRK